MITQEPAGENRIVNTIDNQMREIIDGHTLSDSGWLSRILPFNGCKGLEIRTALQLSINILPFWICTFPLTGSAMSLYWCIFFGIRDSPIFTIHPSIRDLFLVHFIYNPLMYSSTNVEFQRAFVHCIRKMKRNP